MRNQLKKWFAVLMTMVLGMPEYGLSAKNITTKAEDESIVIHIDNEERHVQIGETVYLLDGVSVEGSGEENYRAVVGDVQEQDSGLSLYEEGMEEFVIPEDAAGKTYRVLYKAQSSMDNEVWNDVEGSEKEALLIVDGSHEEIVEENKEETSEEESKEETEKEENNQKEEETPKPITVTLQGKEKEEAEVGEVFSFVHDVTINCSQEDDNTYRIVVREVNTPENGSYSYKEGDISFIPQKVDEGLTYIIHYGVETSKDGEESFERVEGVSFTKEVTVITIKKVMIQGEEERTILAENEYDFIKDSDLVVKGPKEEENSYRLKVKEVKSPENGSYQYHEGDESFTPKESDEGLVYEVIYVAETSKDQTTWEEVEDVQFTQKLTVAVFRAEEVRGPLATDAILCKGENFRNFLAGWNTGSSILVKNLVKADVPSDLMTASLRYKYETISDPSSPVKIYMWHDMNAYGQYVDTVYFGTEVPGATIYTNPDASQMFYGGRFYIPPGYQMMENFCIEKIYDSANPSMPYFFNTSKTTNFTSMFSNMNRSAISSSSASIPFDCTNGNGVSPFGLMDTSSAVNMSYIFRECKNVDFTGIENWDMHKVTDISGMFNYLFNICKIPWDIGNWEFDNLQKVDSFFGCPYKTGDDVPNVEYELNMANWDLSHADTKLMFYQDESSPYATGANKFITRLKLGSKLTDKNGKVNFPWAMAFGYYENMEDYSHPGMNRIETGYSGGYNYYPLSKNYNGAWEREDTGRQYWSDFYNNISFSLAVQLTQSVPSNGTQDLSDAYLANPTAMSGTYKWGEGYSVTYCGYGKTDVSSSSAATGTFSFGRENDLTYKTYFYTNTESGSTHTVLPNMFVADGYDFDHWDSKQTSDGTTYPVGSTIPLTQNQTIYAHWKAKVYSITYITNGGTLDSRNPTTFKKGENGTNIYPSTQTGKFFMGWQITYADGTVEDHIYTGLPVVLLKAQNATLTAVWENAKALTIHGNDGKEEDAGTESVSVTVPDIPFVFVIYPRPANYEIFFSLPNNTYEFAGKTYLCGISSNTTKWKSTTTKQLLKSASLDSSGTDILTITENNGHNSIKPVPVGATDVYLHWVRPAKSINTMIISPTVDMPQMWIRYPDGQMSDRGIKPLSGQWDEDSPNVTISTKGHETGNTNEYVLDYIIDTWYLLPIQKEYKIDYFKIIVDYGSSHTYPTGNLTSYTFTGGFDRNVTICLYLSRQWTFNYHQLDDAEIEKKTVVENTSDLPYTFRNTYPPHADWHGFRVLPLGWTSGIYNQGSPDAQGIYTSTGVLPTLYRGTWDTSQIQNVASPLTLYPLYGVDVNNDGTADVFQNKSTFTITKEVLKGQYSDLTSLMNKVFPYEITFKDVHGDPIKNWPIQDTNGNNYTTDTNGKVTINLRHQESVNFKGMLVNMIIQAVETDTKGMSAEYAISYNGTSFTSGTNTGSITYQDNTPLTVTFKNTAGGNIVPAGIKDTNTRVYVLLGAVLIALAFSIRMLKVRRRA